MCNVSDGAIVYLLFKVTTTGTLQNFVCLGRAGVCGIGYQTLFWRHFQSTPEEESGDGHIKTSLKLKKKRKAIKRSFGAISSARRWKNLTTGTLTSLKNNVFKNQIKIKKNLAKGTLNVLLCHSAAPTRRPAA